MTPAFWSGRRVFVTGHTGFKGAWLSLLLTRLGAKVVGYALAPPTDPSLFQLVGLERRIDSVIADILDQPRLERALADSRPEIVLHLAAQSLVRESYRDPLGTYSTNVIGTGRLLKAIQGIDSVKVALIITSDKCYENNGQLWGYRETDPLGGHDPYSSSKACAEILVASFRASFFTGRARLATARAGNVIGGGDWAQDRLVPDLIRAFIADEPALVRYPAAVRPWQHVLEPLSGYLMLCEHLAREAGDVAEAWNFGPAPEDAVPVAVIAERLAALWGDQRSCRIDGRAQPHEAAYLSLDITKARRRLGYRPRWGLDQALRRSVDWYRAFAIGADLLQLSLRQIDDFIADGAAS